MPRPTARQRAASRSAPGDLVLQPFGILTILLVGWLFAQFLNIMLVGLWMLLDIPGVSDLSSHVSAGQRRPDRCPHPGFPEHPARFRRRPYGAPRRRLRHRRSRVHRRSHGRSVPPSCTPAAQFAADPTWRADILEGPQLSGVREVSPDGAAAISGWRCDGAACVTSSRQWQHRQAAADLALCWKLVQRLIGKVQSNSDLCRWMFVT